MATSTISSIYNNPITTTKAKAAEKVKKIRNPRKKFTGEYGMVFDRFETYEENKADYYNCYGKVFSGEAKDIFEAYSQISKNK